ncbi:MAG: hypothetical protein ISR65_05120 [Bacteriovoracaceae bacterium]|nr:hypothetical protein [Bacteriovoracaceae bacterium]
MKTVKLILESITAGLCLIMVLTSIGHAGDRRYNAPKFRFKTSLPSADIDIKEDNIDSDFSYKVQQAPENERFIASEEDETITREPSSTNKKYAPSKRKDSSYPQGMQYWKFTPDF